MWQKSKDLCPICRTKVDKKNIGPDRIAQNIRKLEKKH